MRFALRVLAGLALLLALALVALALLLPRFAESEAVRERIEAEARDATGLDLSYASLDFGLLPPRLVIGRPSLQGDAEPAFEAESVALRLALAPLLVRTVLVDSLRVEGASLRLIRTKDGFFLPGARPEEPEEEEPSAPSEPSEDDAGFQLGIRGMRLRNARIVLEDRSVAPAVVWELQEGSADLSGSSLAQPVDFAFSAQLASGGRLAATGQASLDGTLRAEVELEEVATAQAAPYLPNDQRLSGALSGSVVVGGKGGVDTLRADLRHKGGEIGLGELSLAGPVGMKADLSDLDAPTGTFSLDASDAELRYAESFRKPAGVPATAAGRVVPGPGDGVSLEDTELRLRNLVAKSRIEGGARTRARFDAAPFDIEGWGALVPALAEWSPRGSLRLDGFVVATEPLEVRGAIGFPDLRLRRGDDPEITVKGALEGHGDEVRAEKLVVSLADQAFQVTARVSGLARAPKLSASVDADDVDTRALLAALGQDKATLEGPLRLRSEFQGPLEAEGGLLESMRGKLRFDIAPGRLRGVSLLRSTFEGLGAAGDAAVLAGQVKGGKTLQRFYQDEFERFGGTLVIASGRATTDDLRLDYRNYQVDLRGSIGLADESLDLTGKITINEEIDEAIAADNSAGAEAPRGRPRVIPLARVTGTLASPRVTLTSEAALRFGALYATDRRREKWERKLDERLGEGSGRDVLDALDSILSGGDRSKPEPR